MKKTKAGIRTIAALFVYAGFMLFSFHANAEYPVIDTQRVEFTVRSLIQAQLEFDQETMEDLLAPEYVEISPLGQLDERREVIGFYGETAAARAKASEIKVYIDLVDVRIELLDGYVVLVARQDVLRREAGGERKSSFIAAYVLDKSAGSWRVRLAQFTPIAS